MKDKVFGLIAIPVVWLYTLHIACANEDDLSQHTLADWSFGEVLFGPAVSHDELQGKAVVVEYWGVRCPPCIALMPKLATLDRRNRSRGLIIIGAESQNSDKDAIKSIIDRANVNFTITRGASGPLNVRGLPRAVVFDAEGALIYSGHPGNSDFDRAVRNALRSVRNFEPSETSSESADPPSLMLESQPWTNADGQEIIAAVKAANETHVIFILQDRTETQYPLANLSEASRAKVIAARDAAE